MKFNKSLLLSACLLSSFGLRAENDMPLDDLMVQARGNGGTIFFVKTVKDFNAIVQSHPAVLACIFDPSRTNIEVVQEILQELTQATLLPFTCLIINTQDAPEISAIYPFSSPATLISFIENQKMEQLDIDLNPLNEEGIIQ